MKKKVLASIVLMVVLLGTFVYATESDIMLINEDNTSSEQLQPTVDANTLINTPLVGTNDNEGAPIPEEWRRNTNISSVIQGDDFNAGDAVEISGKNIDGNAFYAGKTLNISDIIVDGDLFVAGKNIKMDRVSASGNIYVAGEELYLSDNVITGNAYLAGKSITVAKSDLKDIFAGAAEINIKDATYVHRNINVGCSDISISNSTIGRNANIGGNNITLSSEAAIEGSLNYSSSKEATIGSDVVVGSINYNHIDTSEATSKEDSTTVAIVFKTIISIVNAIFVCGFMILFAKGFIEKQKVDNIAKHIAINTAKGLGLAILIPIIALILICTVVAIGLGFIVLTLYIIIFAISASVVSVSIAAAITKNMESNNWKLFGISILVAAVISIIGLIPVLGAIVEVIVAFAGMGLVISGLKVNKKEQAE